MLPKVDSCNSLSFSAICGKNLDEEEDGPNEKLIWLFDVPNVLDELPVLILVKPEFQEQNQNQFTTKQMNQIITYLDVHLSTSV